MANKSARIGSKFEIELVKYLRSKGLDAERLRLAGRMDEGDVVLKAGGVPFVLEAKATKQLDLAGAQAEAVVEAGNYAKARGYELPHYASVHKKRNAPISQAYVVMPLSEWLVQVGAVA